jgi:AraC-like DNA-binding protein
MKTFGHLLIEQVTVEVGQEWMDTASAWHFVNVTQGVAYWRGDDGTRGLAEGETLLIPPAAKGAVRASQIGRVILHAFNFAPEQLCGFLTLSERHFFETSGRALRKVVFLAPTHPVAHRFAAFQQRGSTAQNLSQRAALLLLAATVFERYVPQPSPAPVNTSCQRRFQRIIAELPEGEMIRNTPEGLARLCGCSPRHFSRLFNKHFGKSLRAWQADLRRLWLRQAGSAPGP